MNAELQRILDWFLDNATENDWHTAAEIRTYMVDQPWALADVERYLDEMVEQGVMAKRIGKYAKGEVVYDLARWVWRNSGREEVFAEAGHVDQTPHLHGFVDLYLRQQREEAAAQAQQPQDEPADPPADPDTPEPGESLSEPQTEFDDSTATPKSDALWHLLMLVKDEFSAEVALTDVLHWSHQTKREVRDWAAAVHLRASDNDVDVPPMPEVLKAPVHPGQISGWLSGGRRGDKTLISTKILDANIQYHVDTFGFAVEYDGDHPGMRMLLDPNRVTLHGLAVPAKQAKELLEYIAKPDGEVWGGYGTHDDPTRESDIVARARVLLGYRAKPHYPGDGTSVLVKAADEVGE